MRYWAWPPFGVSSGEAVDHESDWKNMPHQIDESSPHPQINAIAQLCYDAGLASLTTYCRWADRPCESGAYVDNMLEGLKKFFFYSGAGHAWFLLANDLSIKQRGYL